MAENAFSREQPPLALVLPLLQPDSWASALLVDKFDPSPL